MFKSERNVKSSHIILLTLVVAGIVFIFGYGSFITFLGNIHARKGNAVISRSENIRIEPESRNIASYHVSYDIQFESSSIEFFTLKDKIELGLELVGVNTHRDGYEGDEAVVSYDPSDGMIFIEVETPVPISVKETITKIEGNSGIKAQDIISIIPPCHVTLQFEVSSPTMFVQSHEPKVVYEPYELKSGHETDLEALITPFKISDKTGLCGLQISTRVTSKYVFRKEYISSDPPVLLPEYAWNYGGSVGAVKAGVVNPVRKTDFGPHKILYRVYIERDAPDTLCCDDICDTQIFLWYTKSLFLKTKPNCEGAWYVFENEGTRITYYLAGRFNDFEVS